MLTAAGFTDNFTAALSKVWQFLVIGGWFMIPLFVCSLILIAVIFWKATELKTTRILPPDLTGRLKEAGPLIASGKFSSLQQAILHDGSPLASVCRVALLQRYTDQTAAARAAEAAGREEISHLERGVSVLEVIFTITPMIGLIGTVGGLVRVFGNFGDASRSAAAAQEIAAGIAEVMTTTIAGLAIAVPALIAQVYFSRRIERTALRMASLVNQALDAAWQTPDPSR